MKVYKRNEAAGQQFLTANHCKVLVGEMEVTKHIFILPFTQSSSSGRTE